MITPAYAQSASALGGTDMLIQVVPFILIFVIMYFLMIRPQQKRQKDHQEMIKNVRRGDQIVMSGGLIGKIVKVTDDAELELEIADGVRVRVSRSAIADVRSKGEPVKSSDVSLFACEDRFDPSSGTRRVSLCVSEPDVAGNARGYSCRDAGLHP